MLKFSTKFKNLKYSISYIKIKRARVQLAMSLDCHFTCVQLQSVLRCSITLIYFHSSWHYFRSCI